ncbi:Zn-binding domain-containing protein, partial [Paenibacillus phytohabitans]|uniref:Zn-binding domain-containing protein n=1 Tax=Paenibacillus phytohabitans TaxID=2654978 RepID=UPI0030088129
RSRDSIEIGYGDVSVQAMATIFKKIKFETHENIGSGPIHLPEEELHTSSAWISLKKSELEGISDERIEEGLVGVANVLRHVAPLMTMCDPSDLHVVQQVKAVHNEQPTIFLYDRYPGGIGLSEKVYDAMENLLRESEDLIRKCSCESGCPSCIGTDVVHEKAKTDALTLISKLKHGKY